ncbi:DUF1934 domain-containing protein [Paenibacillus soyae]|uniref:DUF1934 domain-containing protein n=1 Tax=Paenibacillus soyae TaxID=2969249 RepID=A0A9X2MWM2_9BACL|nr:DUF1934 domain-containing protein [Paenibacillus soyae]MCR2807775.1 DUF1934 domain-containing protein [Paenibacillus soyae]
MNDSGKAIIMIESKADGEKSTHKHKGEWFRKERSLYIRYAESESTRAIVRYSPGELFLKRSGGVQSEQLFVPGQTRIGTYRSALTTFELETRTKSLSLQAKARGDAGAALPSMPPFTLDWRYELYVSEQLSGRFHIRLHLQEDHEA